MPTFEPLIPSSVWLALAAAAIVLLLVYARRRPVAASRGRWLAMLGLMSLSIALVLVILLNPTWVEKAPPPAGKPVLTVLVDATASMATPDTPAGLTRYRSAVSAAARARQRLDAKFDVRVRAFTDAVTAADPRDLPDRAPEGASTDLAAALADALGQEHLAGQAVLLLSDGIHNTTGGAARVLESTRLAKAMAAPVYTRTYGGEQNTLDIAVEARFPQDLAFVQQKVPVTVRVKQAGPGFAKADVLLLHDGKEVARRTADLTPAGPADVHFMIAQDKAGLYPYEIKAVPLPGEVSQANNSASYLLRVVDEPIRVLVLEGKPYWDSKFLTRTLSTDPSVALDSIVKLAQGRLIRRTISSGATEKKEATAAARTETWKILNDPADVLGHPDRLKGYQIVVLGRDAEVFLTDAAVTHLQNWIAQDGGSLVCYRGAPTAQVNQGMAKLMPVKWTPAREARVRVKLTEQGKDLRWMGGNADAAFARLPALSTASQVESNKALSVVLATAVVGGGQEMPAVVYQPYGTGRVVVLNGAGTWRWAFTPSTEQSQEEVYTSLWHSLLRWLVSGANLLPGQKLTLRTDKVSFTTTEDATVTLFTREEQGANLPPIEIATDGAEKRQATPAPVGDEPGSFRANFGKLPPGRYQATTPGQPDAKTVFDVKAFGEEQLNLAARPDLMKRIADETGGAALPDDAVEVIATQFDRHMEKTRPAAIRRTTAWDRWWVLMLVFGVWAATWTLRRNSGLV